MKGKVKGYKLRQDPNHYFIHPIHRIHSPLLRTVTPIHSPLLRTVPPYTSLLRHVPDER